MLKTRSAPRLARGRFVVALSLLLGLLTLPGGSFAWESLPDLPRLLDEHAEMRGGPRPLYAIVPPYVFTHNVGFLQLQITNIGMIGNTFIEATSAGWRSGEYLYAAGLWVGALRADRVRRVSTGVYENEFLPPIDPQWTVYEGFEGMQGGNRIGFSTDAVLEIGPDVLDVRTSGANDDWNSGMDTDIDEDFLNGLDDDLDGAIDEDFEAVSQQMFSCQYWDISPQTREIYPEHEPLDLLVQQRSFAWATAGANEFVGLDFKIWNIGTETLNDVFIAFFVDGDAGPKSRPNFWVDDKGGFVSIDTTVTDATIAEGAPCRQRNVSVDIAYIFDTPDTEINEEEGGTKGGDVSGYFGGMFLGHSTDVLGVNAPSQVGIRLCRFFSSMAPYPAGDPRNDFDRYDLISGQGVPSRETTQPDDYRYVISAGPFRTLPRDTFLTFQTAFVIGEGKQGMIENAITAQLIFDGLWRNVDGNDETGSGGKETCIRPPQDAAYVLYDSPCDSVTNQIQISWDGYCGPGNYVDNDCNPCTPLGEGNETLVHWVGTVAPPPPLTNTECNRVDVTAPEGDRQVILQWDNLSELKADPLQKKVLFGGYRIWRVEGWRRPVGSTGPAPEEWQLLTQIVRHPTGNRRLDCRVPDPETAGDSISFEFHLDYLGNWPQYLRSSGQWQSFRELGYDPCEACPELCWPARTFFVDTLLAWTDSVATGDTTAAYTDSITGETIDRSYAYQYPVGYYTYVDTLGLKNGMIYFYDLTAFSAWDEILESDDGSTYTQHVELSGRPAAKECQMVVPTWPSQDTKDEVYVVPNPYVQGAQPWGWDLIPSDADPTGTRIAFANLPKGRNVIKIYTLAGDLVQTLEHRAVGDRGTMFWNLVSRNGQDIVAGVYLFTVKTDNQGTKVGRFVVIR